MSLHRHEHHRSLPEREEFSVLAERVDGAVGEYELASEHQAPAPLRRRRRDAAPAASTDDAGYELQAGDTPSPARELSPGFLQAVRQAAEEKPSSIRFTPLELTAAVATAALLGLGLSSLGVGTWFLVAAATTLAAAAATLYAILSPP